MTLHTKGTITLKKNDARGLLSAFTIMALWLGLLVVSLSMAVSFTNPIVYLLILVIAHLYTGLFITAHDAMHGMVHHNKKLNTAVGYFVTALYMFINYGRLFTRHHKHHDHVHTADDPDYHNGSFIAWFFKFLKEYITIWQILFAAIAFNLLKLIIPVENLLLFWILPSILSMFQLFYFGTYVPHKGEHNNEHHSTTLKKNHIWAFISCYFFGYHYEHHDSPATPWWLLWKLK